VARDAREAYSERQRDEVLGRAAEAAKASTAAPAPSVGGRDGLSAQNAAHEEAAASLDKRVEPDSALAATAWLERIRARMKSGDTDGARASLRLFVQRHPDRAIPADLRPLLGE
jgi:TolA-binding protein